MQRGDSSSFGSLVERHKDRLERYLSGRGCSEHDAEDMAQETFLRALAKIGDYQPDRCFEAWLVGIASNVLAEHYRRKRPALSQSLDLRPAGAAPDGQGENLWASAQNVLPQKEFAALYLRYSQGCSIKQAAGIMGLSSIHVKVLLYRARKRLLTSAKFRRQTLDDGSPAPTGGAT